MIDVGIKRWPPDLARGRLLSSDMMCDRRQHASPTPLRAWLTCGPRGHVSRVLHGPGHLSIRTVPALVDSFAAFNLPSSLSARLSSPVLVKRHCRRWAAPSLSLPSAPPAPSCRVSFVRVGLLLLCTPHCHLPRSLRLGFLLFIFLITFLCFFSAATLTKLF
jgi:hypothetical protein